MKVTKLIWQWQGVYSKIDHWYFRVIGMKLAKKSSYDTPFFSFFTLTFYSYRLLMMTELCSDLIPLVSEVGSGVEGLGHLV